MTATSLQTIPLYRLIISPQNVRRTNRKADIAALAASIASHGLLQNLAVTETDEGKFEVVAGGRRLAALKMLAKSGGIARDYLVPCHIVGRETGSEASLAENFHRVAMDPVDEAEAFAQLHAEGMQPDEIARRFGVTRRHVEQRLALANLSPKLKAAWKRGDLTLEAAKAFCLADDHARQDAVFKSMRKPVTHAATVRACLMEGRMRASDRLARFVGLDAYEAAGGPVRRDLFDAEAVFLADPSLLAQLAEARLEAVAAQWRGRGWGWIETALDGGRPEGLSAMRLQPVWRDPTEEEQSRLDVLQAEIEALDAALEASSTEDDPRWSMRDDLEAAFETIRQEACVWDGELMAHAGVLVGVAHDGEVVATEGMVRKADQKLIDALRRQRDRVSTGRGDGGSKTPECASPNLPRAVARDLTRVRTRAIQAGVAGDPDIALALCVAALETHMLGHKSIPGLSIAAILASGDGPEHLLANRIDAELPDSAEAVLVWRLAQDRTVLLAHLAALVAAAIDLSHEDATPADSQRQGIADILAAALHLDMRDTWSPSLDYWMRLPKNMLVEELVYAAEAHGLTEAETKRRSADATRLKKEPLAQCVDDAWRGRGYLPELLITPLGTGALLVNPNAVIVAAE